MGAIEWVTEGDNYECSLPKETQKLAKEELREDKNTRDQALEQIRNWIKLNPRIQNCRLGERIISSFSKIIRSCSHARKERVLSMMLTRGLVRQMRSSY